MTLIERGFAHAVSGEAVVQFQHEAVAANLRFPLFGNADVAPAS